MRSTHWFLISLVVAALSLLPNTTRAQQNQIMGELQFSGATKTERDSGVWIDGQYVGYVKELRGDKRIMLLPGDHEISVRQAGYKDYTKEVVVEPGRTQLLAIRMEKDLRARYPAANAAILKLDVAPERAAVFMDDAYVGHAEDFGGAFHSMLISPGTHRVKIELPGYQTFETQIDPLPGQKTAIKTELVQGSIQKAGLLIKQR